MKIGIMQPYFFPYIGYWELINAVDKYVIYDDVNYINRGWINRNNILVNGEAKLINLQMNKASQNKLINEIDIKHNDIYNEKLLKTIKESYSKAPFIKNFFPLVESVINQDETNIAKYLAFSIREVCKYLNIETEILISSEIKKNTELKGQDKILEICHLLSADQYINAIGGKALYSNDDFDSQGIALKFLKTHDIRYKQIVENAFVPNLSIIDVMMFNEPERINVMLDNYELISLYEVMN